MPKTKAPAPTTTRADRDRLTAEIDRLRADLGKAEIARIDPTLTPGKKGAATKKAAKLQTEIKKKTGERDKLTNRLKQEKKNADLAAKKSKQKKKKPAKSKGGGKAVKKSDTPPVPNHMGLSVVRQATSGTTTGMNAVLQTPMLASPTTAAKLAGPAIRNHPVIQNGAPIRHLWIEDSSGTGSGDIPIPADLNDLEKTIIFTAKSLGFKQISVWAEV